MAAALQQGDVLLFQTDDDGEIEVLDGVVTMSPGLETSAYLSLFGGNEDDDGLADNPFNWWGNLSEVPAEQYRSRTQRLLESLPVTSGNLLRVQAAVEADLQWVLDENVASLVAADVSIPAINRIKIIVQIEARGVESTFTFTENWRASV